MNQGGQITLSVLIMLLVGGGYLLYRKSISSPEKVALYLESAIPISPTTCKAFGANGFEGTLSGNLYMDGLKMRAEIHKVDRGTATDAQAISTDGRTVYVWASATKGAKMSMPEFNAAYDFRRTTLTCSAWWSPNESLFELPAFTPFS